MRDLLFLAACSAPVAAWLWLILPPGNTTELKGCRLAAAVLAGVIAFAVLLALAVVVPILLLSGFYAPINPGVNP